MVDPISQKPLVWPRLERMEHMKNTNGEISDGIADDLRPGWQEIAVGLITMIIVGYFGGALVVRLVGDPVVVGIILTAWSGIAGLIAFAAAARLRLKRWDAFGVKATSWKWVLVGLGAGVLAFLLKGLAVMAFIAVSGQDTNPQEIFAAGATGGLSTIVISTIFLGILTPIGEEFLFRGVVTNALLRYGPIVGVVGGAIIFALFHGINVVLPAAFVAGLIAGEVFRRSGSIWPAVLVHVMFNLPTIPATVILAASQPA